jgi:hypothetical protein
MDDLDVKESVPGLIWIVENEKWNRVWAARTLAHFKDSRAVPALRKALIEEANEDHRQYILEGLVASGGVTEAEQVASLWAFAAKLTTTEGREQVERYRSFGDEPLPLPVSMGRYLARKTDVSERLVAAVLRHVERERDRHPTEAQALLEVTRGWQARLVDLDIVERIAKGTADANTIANALERRAKLRESVGSEVQALSGLAGAAQGIGAALLDDENLAQNIIGSHDESAQLGLIVCARLIQMSLPVRQVGSLMKRDDGLLALAAERYLLANDTEEARLLLWDRHPNEGFVTGWRENIQIIGGNNFDAMANTEERLRAELFKENPPSEIFALLANNELYGRVLRVYPNRAVYSYYEDPARYSERVISSAELGTFKNFVAGNNLTELGPQFSACHHDCWPSEFLWLTKGRGRRVFSHQGIGGCVTLQANFDQLGRGEGLKVHYYLEDRIKGLEVLFADSTLVVKDVWQQGKDIRIFVKREETPQDAEKRQEAISSNEDDEVSPAELRRQETARLRARFSWRTLAAGITGETTTQPDVYSSFDESKFEIDDEAFPSHLNQHLFRATKGGTAVLAGGRGDDEGGLWRKTGLQKPIRIGGDGQYANPVVTDDGKWAVAAKTDTHWGNPNYVVRVNLQTGREYRVSLPAADQFEPVVYIALHSSMLLRRAREEIGPSRTRSAGPETPEYYLLNCATGGLRFVRGTFEPLREEGMRFLQPTNTPNEFWAAIPDRTTNQTQVGRYNLNDFSFKPLLQVPHITFDSTSMWIDEGGARMYLVYEGQLLRLPLRSAR